jgi:ubiquinone/menaquinone biosynthesis C-methylase UbiE
MFTESTALYDLIYSEKDYDAEAQYVVEAIHERIPAAVRLLDVACGTGEHAHRFAGTHGFQTTGIDVEPAFVSLAQRKVPSATFVAASMTDFDLGTTFDAVVCLFSSIGYVRTVANLRHAITAMARHVAPAGVLVVEPWFEPGAMQHGQVTCLVREGPEGSVCRMTHTEIDGNVSRLHFEYLVGTPSGVERLSEHHELGLFSREDMVEAFRQAGFAHVEMDVNGPTGRGLYIAART